MQSQVCEQSPGEAFYCGQPLHFVGDHLHYAIGPLSCQDVSSHLSCCHTIAVMILARQPAALGTAEDHLSTKVSPGL